MESNANLRLDRKHFPLEVGNVQKKWNLSDPAELPCLLNLIFPQGGTITN